MGVTTTNNKPINPRGNDQSPKGYNRASLFSGKALDFDGVNDVITMPTALTSSLSTTSVTFVTNVKTDFATWSGTRDDAFSFAERGMILAFNGGNIYYYYRHQSSGWRNLQVPNADFKPQEWNQMVTTIDLNADTWKAYINGVEVASSGTYSDTAIAYDANALTIGGEGSARSFDGQIAGFKIFNTALTAAQVADLYNNPEKVVPTGVDNTALKLWLPMMEGAGTTAYDGSGNGNHGTISGATYVNGIGAPVAQSAVMDWNKLYDFDGSDLANVSTYLDTTGTKTYKVHFNTHDVTRADQQIFQFWNNTDALGMSGTINFLGTNSGVLGIRGYGSGVSFDNTSWSGLTDNTFYELEFTIDWDAESITSATLNGVASDGSVSARLDTTNNGLYLGARVGTFHLVGIINYFEVVGEDKWTNASGFKSQSGSYDMTISGSPTQILAPQGLTTGRDITGVNLFENVRKQGALNLDGNSWAEVHDNASLDFGTGSFTLEAWVKVENINTGAGINAIFGLGGNATAGNTAYIETNAFLNTVFRYNTGVSVGPTLTRGDWAHIVGVFDGTNTKIYSNGVLEDTDAATAVDISNSEVKLIGRDSAVTRYYKDQIAQPRIYNRALTAEEVQRSYDSNKNIYTNS